MSNKIELALERLNGILPLKQSQEACGREIKHLHQQLLKSFVIRGRALSKEEISHQIDDVVNAMAVLSQRDMASFSNNGKPMDVYPFCATERDYLIQVNEHSVYAMCALDALAIAPMFDATTQISSHCKITGEQIVIQMAGEQILNMDETREICVGVSWGDADADASCADSLCKEMVFLRDYKTAQQWLADTTKGGEVFTLLEATEFANRFFVPLMY